MLHRSYRRHAYGAPFNTVLPAISGTLETGETLTVTNGTWAYTPTSYTRQWKRDGVSIGSATNATYVLVTADEGTTVTATITATNANGASDPATSAGVGIPVPEEQAPLLDLQADALVLSDGDPVSPWTNIGTPGGSFTASGSARPTKQTIGGYPAVVFDGVDDFMEASAAINTALDNLSSFTIFLAARLDPTSDGGNLICKLLAATPGGAGWSIDDGGGSLALQQDDDNVSGMFSAADGYSGDWRVWTEEVVSFSAQHVYANGSSAGETPSQAGTVTTIANATAVRLGVLAPDEGYAGGTYYAKAGYRAIRVYAPALDATARQAKVVELAARYGITL